MLHHEARFGTTHQNSAEKTQNPFQIAISLERAADLRVACFVLISRKRTYSG
jgi:hypothetical protein